MPVRQKKLAWATSVVRFDLGGNSDMIQHKQSGYLDKAFDMDDIAYGIDRVLNNPDYDALYNINLKYTSLFCKGLLS